LVFRDDGSEGGLLHLEEVHSHLERSLGVRILRVTRLFHPSSDLLVGGSLRHECVYQGLLHSSICTSHFPKVLQKLRMVRVHVVDELSHRLTPEDQFTDHVIERLLRC
jgi:hypothetical protein